MIDPVTLQRLGFAALFAALATLIVFMRMLPLDTGFAGMPPPDIIVLLGFAWVLRRPDYVPVVLFAAILFVTDLLFLRPPGVTTALAVIGLEALRSRAGLLRDQPFALEWATVGAVLVFMLLAERILLAVFFVGQVSFGLSAYNLLVNVAFYPVVVAISVWGFHVRRLAPGTHAAEARMV